MEPIQAGFQHPSKLPGSKFNIPTAISRQPWGSRVQKALISTGKSLMSNALIRSEGQKLPFALRYFPQAESGISSVFSQHSSDCIQPHGAYH